MLSYSPKYSRSLAMTRKTTRGATAPIVLPSSHTENAPPESFPDPSRGELTWHTLLSYPQTPSDDLSAGLAVCPAGTGHLCRHRHSQAEIYYILEGTGTVTIDGNKNLVSKGSVVFIPGDAEHGIVNTGKEPLRWFYVFPTGSFQDVVYRFSENDAPKSKL